MLNLRRQRSTSASAIAMIAFCSGDGGSGKYSSFEHGRTSTGRSSAIVSHASRARGPAQRLPVPPVAHLATSNAPRMNGWMRQKYVTTSPGL